MSQFTDDLIRSELRALRGHYRRRVYVAFLIPALIAAALGWLLFLDRAAESREPSQATPQTTISGPIIKEVASKKLCSRPQGSKYHAGPGRPGPQALASPSKALTHYREGKISLAEARQRWDKTTKVGLAAPTRSTSKPRCTRRPPPPAGRAAGARRVGAARPM
jgi:hypothetical protein